jgi:hypothetical protein
MPVPFVWRAILMFASLFGGPRQMYRLPEPYHLPPQIRGFNQIQHDFGTPVQQKDGSWKFSGDSLWSLDADAVRQKYYDQYWSHQDSQDLQMFQTKFSKDGKTLLLRLPVLDRQELRELGVRDIPENVFYYAMPDHKFDSTWKLEVQLA